jgi:hypothetical protein
MDHKGADEEEQQLQDVQQHDAADSTKVTCTYCGYPLDLSNFNDKFGGYRTTV